MRERLAELVDAYEYAENSPVSPKIKTFRTKGSIFEPVIFIFLEPRLVRRGADRGDRRRCATVVHVDLALFAQLDVRVGPGAPGDSRGNQRNSNERKSDL